MDYDHALNRWRAAFVERGGGSRQDFDEWFGERLGNTDFDDAKMAGFLQMLRACREGQFDAK